jgi:hypothetical protein
MRPFLRVPRKRPTEEPAEPWRSFLTDLDAQLTTDIEIHCIGGFVVTQVYGLSRETSDVDFLTVSPLSELSELIVRAGEGSALHKKHRVYIDPVTVTNAPEEYASRLAPLFRNAGWIHIRLFALEAHDLALTKLERNNDRDRRDVRLLAEMGRLQPATLETRYRSELRPYLTNVERHDLTLKLWLDSWAEAHTESDPATDE